MSDNIINQNQDTNSIIDFDTSEKIKQIFVDGTAKNTLLAYKSDFEYFVCWAKMNAMPCELPFDKDVVIKFIVDHLYGLPDDIDDALIEVGMKAKKGPHKISTIQRRIAAISSIHKLKKLSNPCDDSDVKLMLKKAKKAAAKNGYKINKKTATTADILGEMLSQCDDSIVGIRDRAILMFAFSSGGRRRSEVVSANIEDLQKVPNGYLVSLGVTKTDQTGEQNLQVPVLGASGSALEAWLNKIGNPQYGPLFRALTPKLTVTNKRLNDKAIPRIVKRLAEKAGYDPRDFSGHSMRSGFITEGGRQNINIFQLMELSGHKSIQTAKGYYRTGNIVNNPASTMLDKKD